MSTIFSETGITIVYLIGMVIIGFLVSKKIKSSDDFLAGGRKMPYWLVTATLFATWWGGGTLLGGAGAAYYDGFHGVLYDPIGGGLTLILAAFLFMKIIHDAKVNTLAQFFTCRYDPSISRISALVLVPTYILFTATQLVAMGKIFEFVLGWPYYLTIILGTGIIVFYTILGGIVAVAWTDVIQVVLILVGILILLPISISKAGGWSEIVAHTPKEFFAIFPAEGSALAPPTLSGWLWWFGALFGVGLGSLAAPELYQRAIIAKSGKVASRSSITAGIGYWTLGVIPVFLAFAALTMIAKGSLPENLANIINDDSEMLILVLLRHSFSPAVAGLFIAALLAAIMSTGDSAIFATGAVISNDLIKPLYEKRTNKKVSDKRFVLFTRLSIAGFTALALLVGFFYDNMYDLLVLAFQMLFHILFFPLILGVYWKKANTPGAIVGMLTGFVVIIGWMIAVGTIFPEPEWLSTLGPATVGGIAMIVTSLFTQKKYPARPLMSTDGRVLKFASLVKK